MSEDEKVWENTKMFGVQYKMCIAGYQSKFWLEILGIFKVFLWFFHFVLDLKPLA